MAKSQELLSPIHSGEILSADFMEPMKLSMNGWPSIYCAGDTHC